MLRKKTRQGPTNGHIKMEYSHSTHSPSLMVILFSLAPSLCHIVQNAISCRAHWYAMNRDYGWFRNLYAKETSDSDKIFTKINVFVFPIIGVVLLATHRRARARSRPIHMVSLLLIAILGALCVFLDFRLTHGNFQNWSKSCKNGLKLQQNWTIFGLPPFHSSHQTQQTATHFR